MLPCLANKLHTPKSPPTKITNSKNFMWTSAFAFTGHGILYDSFRVLYPLFTIKAPVSHSNHLLRNQRAAKKQCPLLIMSLIGSAPQRILSLLTTEWLLFKSTILCFFFFFSELEGALEIIFPQCIRGMEASDQGKVLYPQPYLLSGRGQRVQRKDQNQLWKLQLPQKVHSSKYFFLRGSTRSSGICPGRLRVHYCPDLCQTCASISLLVNQE